MIRNYGSRRFLFRAGAVGLGSAGIMPFHAQATSCLPAIGGEAGEKTGNFEFHDYIQFHEAETFVAGRIFNNVATTEVHALVTGLQINGEVPGFQGDTILIAPRTIEARSFAEHRLDDSKEEIPIITSFNLETILVLGQLVRVTPNNNLLKKTGWSQLQEHQSRCRGRDMVHHEDTLYYSLVESLDWVYGRPPGCVTLERNHIKIEGFGSIYLGELIRSAASTRFSMIRIELDPAFEKKASHAPDQQPLLPLSRRPPSGFGVNALASPGEPVMMAMNDGSEELIAHVESINCATVECNGKPIPPGTS